MLTPEDNQTKIIRRQGEYKLPRSLQGKTLVKHAHGRRSAPGIITKHGVVVTDVPYHVHNDEKE